MSACPAWCTDNDPFHQEEDVHSVALDASTPNTEFDVVAIRWDRGEEDGWTLRLDLEWEIVANRTSNLRTAVTNEITELRAVLDNAEAAINDFVNEVTLPGLGFDEVASRWPHLTASDIGRRIPRHKTTRGVTYWLEADVLRFLEGASS